MSDIVGVLARSGLGILQLSLTISLYRRYAGSLLSSRHRAGSAGEDARAPKTGQQLPLCQYCPLGNVKLKVKRSLAEQLKEQADQLETWASNGSRS